jgi:subtilisin family serine protease
VQQGSGNAVDGDGHGTHVAGIIAGHGNNAAGIAGTCWTASVMPIRFMNSQSKGSTLDAVTGLDYAIHQHAKVINCSFGSSSKSSALEDAVKAAESAGVLLVVAAGNNSESIESDPEYPASYTQGNILTVAAVDATGALASFSNYGSKSVDLAAPGDEIFSTYPTSSYKLLSGTSMAAPMVAATAAMLHAQDPHLTYSQIRNTIKASVVPDAALAGKTLTGRPAEPRHGAGAGRLSVPAPPSPSCPPSAGRSSTRPSTAPSSWGPTASATSTRAGSRASIRSRTSRPPRRAICCAPTASRTSPTSWSAASTTPCSTRLRVRGAQLVPRRAGRPADPCLHPRARPAAAPGGADHRSRRRARRAVRLAPDAPGRAGGVWSSRRDAGRRPAARGRAR